MAPGRLKEEIKQKRPFSSVHEEVVLALFRTADEVILPTVEVVRSEGLTVPQYNILRILRGGAREGLPCGEISDRMVRRDPDLTRLLDRLEKHGLVTRSRDLHDRRVVRTKITKDGLRVLGALDAPVLQSHKKALGHMSKERLRLLAELLDEARSR